LALIADGDVRAPGIKPQVDHYPVTAIGSDPAAILLNFPFSQIAKLLTE